MTRTPILVLTPVPADLRRRLAIDYDLVDLSALQGREDAPAADLSDFRVALTTSMAGADEAIMAAMPRLGLIACNGAGLDRIDLAAARRRGVAISHTPDEVTQDTAEFAIALLYATARRTAEADRFVRAGRWLSERMQPSRRVCGRTMGIVGLGRIGRGVARRAIGIGMSVAYTARGRKSDVDYRFEPELRRLAEVSDVLVLCCSGGEATRHIVNAEVLAALGREGILINIARGSVVDEPALIAALRDGTIAAAGLDVFACEPRIDERLLTMDNVVLQPHYASLTHETRAAMIERIRSDIASFLSGEAFHDAAGASGGGQNQP